MMRAPPLVALRDVRLTLGAAPLFSGASLALSAGDRIALVGRNGAGKSTLMRILAGSAEADGGEVFRQPGATILHLAQEPDLSAFANALDAASAGLSDETVWRAESELLDWGLAPSLRPREASGGQLRRMALARAFAAAPDILLLDEPTNHLDVEAIEQLEERLAAFRGAIMVVSHDRRFLETVSTGLAWLRQGVVRTHDKGYGAYEEWAASIEDAEERALDRLDTQLAAEERWMARGVTARRRRNMGRVRKLLDMRSERRQRRIALFDAAQGAQLAADSGQASSRLVIEARGLEKSFPAPGGSRPIIQDLSLRVMRGDRIGILGPNGSGKTTLLRLLLGRLDPDSGDLRRAANLEIAYLDQTRARLDPATTLWDALTPLGGDQVMVRGAPRHVAAYARDFLFDPRQLRQPVRALSGGERNRLTLAIALAQPCNLLVMDEPTNDLDIETLDLLEDMLTDYDGTLLVVSHDRAFLDNVVTSLLTPLGDGRWLETPGGYADYLLQRPRNATGMRIDSPAPQQRRETAAAPAGRPAGKLTYRDARRLAELEAEMPRLQAEIARLEADLADPALFSKDRTAFSAHADRLTLARANLDQAETEWLVLDEKRASGT
jgi:ABC transport system ATP-binding/permease protein